MYEVMERVKKEVRNQQKAAVPYIISLELKTLWTRITQYSVIQDFNLLHICPYAIL